MMDTCRYTLVWIFRTYTAKSEPECQLLSLGDNDVNVGSLIVTSVPLWRRLLTVGQAVTVWGQRVYGNAVLSAQFHCETKTTLKKMKPISLKRQKVCYRWTVVKEKSMNCCTENCYYEEVELRNQASWQHRILLDNGQQKGSIYSCPATSPHIHHSHLWVTSTPSVPTIVRVHFLEKILYIFETESVWMSGGWGREGTNLKQTLPWG